MGEAAIRLIWRWINSSYCKSRCYNLKVLMFEDATRPESATEDHIWKGRDALTHSQPHYSIINSNNDKGRELKQRQVCAMVRSLEYECEMNTIVQQVKDL